MRFFGLISTATAAGLLLVGTSAAETGEHFIIHELDKAPEAAAAHVRSHVEAEDDWLFLA